MSSVEVACSCAGRNPACTNCDGSGVVRRVACRRCAGTGTESTGGKPCFDCRGAGWRNVDQPGTFD